MRNVVSSQLEKTLDRVNQFIEKNELSVENYKINGIDCEPVSDLLNKIDWDDLSAGIPYLFHGDLQPENIIYNEERFFLIDWRDSFGLSTKYGDIYYDLAKLNHALLISGSIVRSNNFSFNIVVKCPCPGYTIVLSLNLSLAVFNFFSSILNCNALFNLF